MRPSVRTAALITSVLLHVGLFAWLASLRDHTHRPDPQPIELTVHYVHPVHDVHDVRAPPQSPRAPQPESRGQAPQHAQAAEKAAGGRPGVARNQAAEAAASLRPAPRLPAGSEEGVRRLDLDVPSHVGESAVESGGTKGQGETWRNEPGGFPDPNAAREAGIAEAKRNVDGMLAAGLAARRAETGADPYFQDVRKALEEHAAIDSNKLLSGNAAKDLAAAYQDGASRYVATGNPYAPGALPSSAPAVDGDTPINRNAQQFQGAEPEDMQKRLEAARSLRDFAEGKFGNGLLAIVELRQGTNGRLLQITLTEPSGNAAFDAHVMRSAPAAIESLKPPPDKGVGIHADGMRSSWSFEGRIVYKRKLRDMSVLRDGWYLGLLAATQLIDRRVPGLVGSFDEKYGDAEVPDFRHPEFQLKVKLLRIY